MKPAMGLYIIRSKNNNKCSLEATQNLKGKINSTRFKLNAGGHPNRELQQEWSDFGEANFTIEILEYLEYDEKDEGKTDYTEELSILQMMWEEKLKKEGMEFYRRLIQRRIDH